MNFSSNSALVISDNFILSLTLTGILKKDPDLCVYESQGFTSSKNILLNERPDVVFIDTDIRSFDIRKLQVLSDKVPDVHICFISHPENMDSFRNQNQLSEYRTSIISKPFDQDDILKVLNSREPVLV